MDSTNLLSLAWRFPEAAKYAWQAHRKCKEFAASLSPDVRGRIKWAWDKGLESSLVVKKTAEKVYCDVIAFPYQAPTEWTQPTSLILSPLARLILFFLPVSSDWESSFPKDGKVLFICNSYYSLEVPAVHSAIYMQTGRLVRFTVDPLHFKLPLWKHVLEYLGAVPESPSILPELMSAGFTVIAYVPEPPRAIEGKPLIEDASEERSLGPALNIQCAAWALENGYSVIPATAIGASDMFQVLCEVPPLPEISLPTVTSLTKPWTLKLKRPSMQSPQTSSRRLRVIVPRSYQRQYVRFAAAKGTRGTSRKVLEKECAILLGKMSLTQFSDEELASALAFNMRFATETSYLYLCEAREEDPRRHVLAPLWKAVRRSGDLVVYAEQKYLGGKQMIRRKSAVGLRALADFVDVPPLQPPSYDETCVPQVAC
ncbi:hypothetical protein HDU85_001845 [Gaertneriomyces sp. JEL0708]|nr:hypothetical protein HDU85_001845 [Gaertneriomyces sp. JEL0708]